MSAILFFVVGFVFAPQDEIERELGELVRQITPSRRADWERPGMRHLAVQARMSASRMEALERLRELRERGKPAVDILTALIEDPLEPIHFKAMEIQVLGAIGPSAIGSKPALERLLQGKDRILRDAANFTLLKMEQPGIGLHYPTNRGTDSQVVSVNATDFERYQNAGVIMRLPASSSQRSKFAQFSPCGRFVVAYRVSGGMFASSKMDFELLELSTNRLLVSSDGPFQEFVFDPTRDRVYLDRGVSVTVWSTRSGERVAKLGFEGQGVITFKFAAIRAMSLLRDGRYLAIQESINRKRTPERGATQGWQSRLRLWDTETWKEKRIEAHDSWSDSIYVAEDARIVAICEASMRNNRKEIVIWDVENGRRLASPELDQGGRLFGTDDPDVLGIETSDEWFAWSLSEQKLTKMTTQMIESATASRELIGNPGQNWQAASNCGLDVRLRGSEWELVRTVDGRSLGSFRNPSSWYANAQSGSKFVLNEQSMMLVSRPWYSGGIRIWQLDQQSGPKRLSLNVPVEGIAVSTDGKQVAVLQRRYDEHFVPQEKVHAYIVDANGVVPQRILSEENVYEIQSISKTDQLALRFADRVELRGWQDDAITKSIWLQGRGNIRTFSCAPTNSKVALAGDSVLELWDSKSGKLCWQKQCHRLSRVAISPNEQYVAASGSEGNSKQRIFIYSALDGRLLKTESFVGEVEALHFWKQRDILTVVRQDERVSHLDLNPESQFSRVYPATVAASRNLRANDFATSQANGLFAVAGASRDYAARGELVLRGLLDGESKAAFTSEQVRFTCVCFFGEDQQVAAGGVTLNQKVDIVDLQKGKLTATIEGVTSVVPSPNGKYLLTMNSDIGKISIWRTIDGILLSQFKLPPNSTAPKFSPDGKRLITMTGGLRVWDLERLFKLSHNSE
ncbi:MAG: hypothetical protein ACE361_21030 [Aureliella sp.]